MQGPRPKIEQSLPSEVFLPPPKISKLRRVVRIPALVAVRLLRAVNDI